MVEIHRLGAGASETVIRHDQNGGVWHHRGQQADGGIQGLVVYSSTRPFDDQRINVQTLSMLQKLVNAVQKTNKGPD